MSETTALGLSARTGGVMVAFTVVFTAVMAFTYDATRDQIQAATEPALGSRIIFSSAMAQPGVARWSGSNASTYKENLIKVNGFDERFAGWGKEDHELAVRLWNAGFSSRHIRYQAITMHLDHGRPYKNEEKFQRNLAILAESKRTRSVWAPIGIKESGTDHTIEE
mgnify:CR=1 FL=1